MPGGPGRRRRLPLSGQSLPRPRLWQCPAGRADPPRHQCRPDAL